LQARERERDAGLGFRQTSRAPAASLANAVDAERRASPTPFRPAPHTEVVTPTTTIAVSDVLAKGLDERKLLTKGG
jgi:hypothetical protein